MTVSFVAATFLLLYNLFLIPRHSECLASLDNAKSRTRLKEVTKSHDRTFHWLFDKDVVQFSHWLEDKDNAMGPIFWVQGKPGSGKSTLMKFAMQDRRTSRILSASSGHDWTFAGFFFHDRGSNEQKSLVAMLQEILYQILFQNAALFFCVLPYYTILCHDQRTKSPVWDVQSLNEALTDVMKQRRTTACICFFLDALDEHDGDNDQLAMLIHEIASFVDNKRMKAKFCLASRSWNVFGSHFGVCPGFAIQDYTQSDIRSYITSRLNDASAGISPSSHIDTISKGLEALIEQTTQKAYGVFI